MMTKAACGLYHEDINWTDETCPACLLITRLHAEVERQSEENQEVCQALKRERDEALAQVAVLLRDLSGVFDEFEHPKYHALLNDPAVLSAKARTLLDRLQQAEAVVEAGNIESLKSRLSQAREALQEIRSYHTRHYGLAFQAGHMAEIASKALAAWEEGERPSPQ